MSRVSGGVVTGGSLLPNLGAIVGSTLLTTVIYVDVDICALSARCVQLQTGII